jgi:hypothetical protein
MFSKVPNFKLLTQMESSNTFSEVTNCTFDFDRFSENVFFKDVFFPQAYSTLVVVR